MKPIHNRSAFTLIELLVVIAIIAILAAILFPVFAQAKLAAKKTNDLSQNKELALASLMYSGDYDDEAMAFPYAATWSTSCPGCSSATKVSGGANGPFWTDRLQPYVKSKAIFANPSDQDQMNHCVGYWTPGGTSATDTNTSDFYRVTYTYNAYISHGDMNPFTPGAASMTGIPAVADTVLLGPSDSWFSRGSCHPTGNGTTVDVEWDISQAAAGPPVSDFGYELWGAYLSGSNLLNGGFNGGSNFAYADGHAKYAKLSVGGDAGLGTGGTAPGIIVYAGYYPQAKMHPQFTTPGGACTTTFNPWQYAF